jgi:hypothetical protein
MELERGIGHAPPRRTGIADAISLPVANDD